MPSESIASIQFSAINARECFSRIGQIETLLFAPALSYTGRSARKNSDSESDQVRIHKYANNFIMALFKPTSSYAIWRRGQADGNLAFKQPFHQSCTIPNQQLLLDPNERLQLRLQNLFLAFTFIQRMIKAIANEQLMKLKLYAFFGLFLRGG